jgi:hypothetical protein
MQQPAIPTRENIPGLSAANRTTKGPPNDRPIHKWVSRFEADVNNTLMIADCCSRFRASSNWLYPKPGLSTDTILNFLASLCPAGIFQISSRNPVCRAKKTK